MSSSGHIAQMNFGQMKFPLDDPRVKEFVDGPDEVYGLAERSPGFVWRVPDEEMAEGLARHGYDGLTSATVSVRTDVEAMKAYTFGEMHGKFLHRASEWFESIDRPSYVIRPVQAGQVPTLAQAKEKLDRLAAEGSSEMAYDFKYMGETSSDTRAA